MWARFDEVTDLTIFERLMQVNYMLTIGDRELESQTLSVRTRDNQVSGEIKLDHFIQNIAVCVIAWKVSGNLDFSIFQEKPYFVQMLYKQMGVILPRDTILQVKWSGLVKVARNKLRPGDLLYFSRYI